MLDKKIGQRITIFGFIMTCLIIGVHSTALGSEFQPVLQNDFDIRMNQAVETLYVQGGRLAMRFFFMTTGFLLFRDLSFQNFGQKLKKRINSLLIPYIIWQALAILHNTALGYAPDMGKLLQKTFLLDWPVNGPLWYVYVVFLLALLSPVFLLCFRNQKIGFFAILLMCMGLYTYDFGEVSQYGLMSNIIFYLPSYLLGAFFGHFYNCAEKDKTIEYLFYFLAGALAWELIKGGSFDHLAGSAFPILILLYLPAGDRAAELPVYRYSFMMYASQTILVPHLLATVYRLMNWAMPFGFLVNFLGRLACIGFCLLGCMIVYAFMGRFLPKTLGLLTGGRASVRR